MAKTAEEILKIIRQKPEKSICTDTKKFINKCAEVVAHQASDEFRYDEDAYLKDNFIDSPIEQIFHCAFRTLMKINSYRLADPEECGGEMYVVGIDLQPQRKIGKYRVDFLAANYKYPSLGKQETVEVIVECDGHDFHERSESERRYEKARDRFLQQSGYKVFHFTGKEIKDNPFIVAGEVLAHITGHDIEAILPDTYLPEYCYRK